MRDSRKISLIFFVISVPNVQNRRQATVIFSLPDGVFSGNQLFLVKKRDISYISYISGLNRVLILFATFYGMLKSIGLANF